MRRDYHAVRANGLKVMSPDGDFNLTNPKVAQSSEEISTVDWVICALKVTSIKDARALVRPCVSSDTRILVLMNGLGLEESFAEWFNPEQIFGGLAFTCINRGEPGYVSHIAYGSITLGHLYNDPTELKSAVALWVQSKVQVSTSSSFLCARWEKLCWNIPFNGLAVAAGGITTDHIMGDPSLRNTARTLMEEVIEVGNKDLEKHSEDERIDRVAMIEHMFELTDTMGAYRPSTIIDFIEAKAMEVESIFGEPLRRAQLLEVATPQLTLLTALLRALNTHQQDY